MIISYITSGIQAILRIAVSPDYATRDGAWIALEQGPITIKLGLSRIQALDLEQKLREWREAPLPEPYPLPTMIPPPADKTEVTPEDKPKPRTKRKRKR